MPVYENFIVKLQVMVAGVLFRIAVPFARTHLVEFVIFTLTVPNAL